MKKMVEEFFLSNIGDLYRDARSQMVKSLCEEDIFSIELLELEIFGMISFLVNVKLPDDVASRLSKIRDGERLMMSILSRDDISISLRRYLAFVELARVWVLDELERGVDA